MTGSQPYPLHARMEPEEAKELLRRALRRGRDERSERRRLDANRRITTVIGGISEIRRASVVAGYAARSGEPDLAPVLEDLLMRGVHVLLPALGEGLSRDWAEYAGAGDLQIRAPGRPPEPGTGRLGGDAVVAADVVLVPALAVDTRGTRLGQGGGWYDRVLVHVEPRTLVVAVVYDDEVYDADTHPLPIEPHDQPVDAVVTPAGFRWLRRDVAEVVP